MKKLLLKNMQIFMFMFMVVVLGCSGESFADSLMSIEGGVQTNTSDYTILPFVAVNLTPTPYIDFSAKFTMNPNRTLGWATQTRLIYQSCDFSPYVAFDVYHGQNEKFFSLKSINLDLGGGVYYLIPNEILADSSLDIYGDHFVNSNRIVGLAITKAFNQNVFMTAGSSYEIKNKSVNISVSLSYLV
jgi:hypothetical protein